MVWYSMVWYSAVQCSILLNSAMQCSECTTLQKRMHDKGEDNMLCSPFWNASNCGAIDKSRMYCTYSSTYSSLFLFVTGTSPPVQERKGKKQEIQHTIIAGILHIQGVNYLKRPLQSIACDHASITCEQCCSRILQSLLTLCIVASIDVHGTERNSAVQYSTLYCIAISHSTVKYSTVQSTVLSTAQHSAVRYSRYSADGSYDRLVHGNDSFYEQ